LKEYLKHKVDKNGNVTREKNPSDKSGATASVSGPGTSDNWKIISTVYSTGAFDPKIDYQYIYIDLPPEYKQPEEKSDLNLENDDPYEPFKPKNIILGIFRKDGTPLNPNQPLKSINVNGNGDIIQEDSIYKSADWILKSPKWKFPDGVYQWPAFGLPTYTWERYLGAEKQNSKTQPSNSSPAPAWNLKTYKKGEKNIQCWSSNTNRNVLSYFLLPVICKKPNHLHMWLSNLVPKMHWMHGSEIADAQQSFLSYPK
jgi:hypothetical protein